MSGLKKSLFLHIAVWAHVKFICFIAIISFIPISALIPNGAAFEPHGGSSPDEKFLPPPRLFLGAPSPLQETNTKEQ